MIQTRIKNNIAKIQSQLNTNCKLIVVSKYRSLEEIQAAYDCGHRDFAENRVQPLLERFEALPKDIRWHLIGHLQTNKVKYIAPFIHCIHSVDSFKLASEINKEAAKNNRNIHCLIQVHVAQEESKFGLLLGDLNNFWTQVNSADLHHIDWKGLMAMGSFTENNEQIKREFASVQAAFNALKIQSFPSRESFNELSIGMSGDFIIAMQYGSTMVRIGTAIFE